MSNKLRLRRLERACAKLLDKVEMLFIDCPDSLNEEQLMDENTIYLYLEIKDG
jgi:hypothetical protein